MLHYAFLEKDASHTSAHSLSIVENVKLVDQIIHIVAAFGQNAQISNQTDVV